MSNIQFDYSTLSTSISRSELSEIVGQHIVEDSYGGYHIEEETSSENSHDSNEVYIHPPPPDRYKVVYLTFGLLGIGTLLPWNFFITANDYWMYKFRETSNATHVDGSKTDLQAAFTSYVALSNNIPYVIFLLLCTLFNNKLSKMFRVIGSLIAMFILFAISTACVEIDTDKWQMGFFALTILVIIAVGIASAILQAGAAGIVSLLPAHYMHIMVLGQAIAGIVASVAQILSLLSHSDSVKSALIYFFSADTVIFVTLIAYFVIQKSEFFRYHVHSVKESNIFEPKALKDVAEPDMTANVSVLYVTKLLWPYVLSIVLDFWVTIGVFPGLTVLAVSESQGTIWNGKLFLPVACFLLFNISDFCGRAVGGWMPLPHTRRKHLLALSVIRVVLVPLIMLCNLHPRFNMPVVFHNDIFYIVFMTALGFSNGFLIAVAMVVGIKSVNPLLQETAGIILSASLGMGLMVGSLTSYICVKII